MEDSLAVCSLRICAYCLMPNDWHFVLWPEQNGALSAFLQKLTNTRVKR
jgi:putative transposase